MEEPQDVPPALLPGPPSMFWLWRILRCLGIAMVGALLMPVAALLPHGARDIALGVLLVIGVADGGYMLYAVIERYGTQRREAAAGYTTEYNRYYRLWQLDPKTGEVLRRPGERQARRGR